MRNYSPHSGGIFPAYGLRPRSLSHYIAYFRPFSPGIKVAIRLSVMENILLCSQDTILTKGLYGPLRDEGYPVDVVEHPADAVRGFIHKVYDTVIIDSRDIGLDAIEAVSIMKNIFSDTKVLFIVDRKERQGLLAQGNFVIFETPVELDLVIEMVKEIFNATYHPYDKGGVYDVKRSHSQSL